MGLPPPREGVPSRLPKGLPVVLRECGTEAVRESVEELEAQALAQRVK